MITSSSSTSRLPSRAAAGAAHPHQLIKNSSSSRLDVSGGGGGSVFLAGGPDADNGDYFKEDEGEAADLALAEEQRKKKAQLQEGLRKKWARVTRRLANLPTAGTSWRPVLPLDKLAIMKSFFRHSSRSPTHIVSQQRIDGGSTIGAEKSHESTIFSRDSLANDEDGDASSRGDGADLEERRTEEHEEGESSGLFSSSSLFHGNSRKKEKGKRGDNESDDDDTDDEGLKIDEETFIDCFDSLLKQQMPSRSELREWFRDLDINIDGAVSWQEFTSYIVEHTHLGKDGSDLGGGGAGMGRVRKFAPVVNADIEIPKWNSTISRMATMERLQKSVVSVAHDGYMRIWDPTTCRCRITINNAANSPSLRLRQTVVGLSAPTYAGCTDVVFNKRGTHCFVSGTDKSICAYEVGEDESFQLSRLYLGVSESTKSFLPAVNGRGGAGGDSNINKTQSNSNGPNNSAGAVPPVSAFSISEALKASTSNGGGGGGSNSANTSAKRGGRMVDTTVLSGMTEIPTSIDVTNSSMPTTISMNMMSMAGTSSSAAQIQSSFYDKEERSSSFGSREVLFVAQHTGSLILYPTMRQSRVSEIDPISILHPHSQRITKVRYIPQLKGVLTSSWDTTIALTDLERGGVPICVFGSCAAAAAGGGSSGGGIAGGRHDNSVFGDHLRGHSRLVSDFVYCPQQRLIASSGGDRDIMVWALGMMSPIARLSGHTASIVSLAIDGSALTSLDVDNMIKVWDLRNHRLIQTINTATGGNSEEAGNSSPASGKDIVQTSCIAYHGASQMLVACGRQTLFYSGGRGGGGGGGGSISSLAVAAAAAAASSSTNGPLSVHKADRHGLGQGRSSRSSSIGQKEEDDESRTSSYQRVCHSEAVTGFSVVDSADTVISSDSELIVGWNASNGRSRVSWEICGEEEGGLRVGVGGTAADALSEQSQRLSAAISNGSIAGITTDMAERKVCVLLSGGQVLIHNHRNGQRLAFIDPKYILESANARLPPTFHRPLQRSLDPRDKRSTASPGSPSQSSPPSSNLPPITNSSFSTATARATHNTINNNNDSHTNPPLQVVHVSNGENTARYVIILYGCEFYCVDESVAKLDHTSEKARSLVSRHTIFETQRSKSKKGPMAGNYSSSSSAPSLKRENNKTTSLLPPMPQKMKVKKSASAVSASYRAAATATADVEDNGERFTVIVHHPAIGKVTCGNLLLGTNRGRLLVFSPAIGQFLSKLDHPTIKLFSPQNNNKNKHNSKVHESSSAFLTSPSSNLRSVGMHDDVNGGTYPLARGKTPITPNFVSFYDINNSTPPTTAYPLEIKNGGHHNTKEHSISRGEAAAQMDEAQKGLRGRSFEIDMNTPNIRPVEDLVILYHHDLIATVLGDCKIYFWDMRRITLRGFMRAPAPLLCLAAPSKGSTPSPFAKFHAANVALFDKNNNNNTNNNTSRLTGGALDSRGRRGSSPLIPSQDQLHCSAAISTPTTETNEESSTFITTLGDVLATSSSQNGNGDNNTQSTTKRVLHQGPSEGAGAAEGEEELLEGEGEKRRSSLLLPPSHAFVAPSRRGRERSSSFLRQSMFGALSESANALMRKRKEDAAGTYTTSVIVAGDDAGNVYIFDTTPLGLPLDGGMWDNDKNDKKEGDANDSSKNKNKFMTLSRAASAVNASMSRDGQEVVLPMLSRFRVSDTALHSLGYASNLKLVYTMPTGASGIGVYSRFGDRIGQFGQRARWNTKFKSTFECAVDLSKASSFGGTKELTISQAWMQKVKSENLRRNSTDGNTSAREIYGTNEVSTSAPPLLSSPQTAAQAFPLLSSSSGASRRRSNRAPSIVILEGVNDSSAHAQYQSQPPNNATSSSSRTTRGVVLLGIPDDGEKWDEKVNENENELANIENSSALDLRGVHQEAAGQENNESMMSMMESVESNSHDARGGESNSSFSSSSSSSLPFCEREIEREKGHCHHDHYVVANAPRGPPPQQTVESNVYGGLRSDEQQSSTSGFDNKVAAKVTAETHQATTLAELLGEKKAESNVGEKKLKQKEKDRVLRLSPARALAKRQQTALILNAAARTPTTTVATVGGGGGSPPSRRMLDLERKGAPLLTLSSKPSIRMIVNVTTSVKKGEKEEGGTREEDAKALQNKGPTKHVEEKATSRGELVTLENGSEREDDDEKNESSDGNQTQHNPSTTTIPRKLMRINTGGTKKSRKSAAAAAAAENNQEEEGKEDIAAPEETNLMILSPVKSKSKPVEIPTYQKSRLATLYEDAIKNGEEEGGEEGNYRKKREGQAGAGARKEATSAAVAAILSPLRGGGARGNFYSRGLSSSSPYLPNVNGAGNTTQLRGGQGLGGRDEWIARPATMLAVHTLAPIGGEGSVDRGIGGELGRPSGGVPRGPQSYSSPAAQPAYSTTLSKTRKSQF